MFETRMYKQQGPLSYSTGNYIQCLVITYNGKESEKEYIYISESLCCAHLKHCKSTILQFLKKVKKKKKTALPIV